MLEVHQGLIIIKRLEICIERLKQSFSYFSIANPHNIQNIVVFYVLHSPPINIQMDLNIKHIV